MVLICGASLGLGVSLVLAMVVVMVLAIDGWLLHVGCAILLGIVFVAAGLCLLLANDLVGVVRGWFSLFCYWLWLWVLFVAGLCWRCVCCLFGCLLSWYCFWWGGFGWLLGLI